MNNITQWGAIQTLVKTLADNARLHVVYEDEGKSPGPRTDGRTLWVPKPSPFWSERELTSWLRFIYHEVGHNVPEMADCFEIPKKYKIEDQSFTGYVMNILEDYRQEQFRIDEYAGKKRILGEGRGYTLEKYAGIKPSRDPKRNQLLSLMAWETKCREQWMPAVIGAYDPMIENFNEEMLSYIDALDAGNYEEELNNIKTAEDTYALTQRIIKEVFKLDPEEEKKGNGKVEGQEPGEGKPGDKGEEKNQGKNGDKNGEGNETKPRTQAATVNYDDLMEHKHQQLQPSYTPLTIDYSNSKKSNDHYDPYLNTEIKVDDCSNLTDNWRYNEKIPTNATGFSNKVKRLLMIMSKDRNDYGKKHGRLHTKNLYRVTIPQAGEFGKKVFKQKRTSDILDTAVLVLIDMSGSMGGDKVVNACHSGILLNEAITKLQVPTEIIGFTDTWKGPLHTIFKKFSDNIVAEKLRARMIHGTNSMDANADGDSVLWAYNRLKNRKEKKKVMIVLSDGQPASHRGYGSVEFLKQVVNSIQKEGIVNIYGIGIQSDAVKDYYKQHCVIKNSSELEDKLLEVVKQQMLNN